MFGEIMMLEDDNSTVSGYVEIMDMSNVSGNHLLHLPPTLIRKLSMFADEAMPMRQQGTYFINVPSAVEVGFNGLKSLLPEKAFKRVNL